MNVVVTIEHRFDRTPDGSVWTQTMFARPFWSRYLGIFDGVRVVARVREVSAVPEGWQRADGDGVSFVALPYYIGPKQYLRRLPELRRMLRTAVRPDDAVIMRVPSAIAAQLLPTLTRTDHPYAVEVLGDPYDVFAPGAVHHPLRPVFRVSFTRQQQQICRGAAVLGYVTAAALQRRYPAGSDAFATYYSDVELPGPAYATTPRSVRPRTDSLTLVTVGSLAQMYKAPDVQIDAVAHLVREGMDLHLVIVGDGRHRVELEARATGRGIGDRVHFRGQLTAGEAVRAELDAANLFCMPSRTEGMPRAMLEAMARALPCIGSTVGGIPELLPPEDLVPPGDVAALAAKIREIVTDPVRMGAMSTQNLARAQGYREEILRERRTECYRALRARTEACQRERGHMIGGAGFGLPVASSGQPSTGPRNYQVGQSASISILARSSHHTYHSRETTEHAWNEGTDL
jgi:glycosyltransferase involved in cell wall biosynthesis